MVSLRSVLLCLFALAATALAQQGKESAQGPVKKSTEKPADTEAKPKRPAKPRVYYPDPEREELLPGFPVGKPGPLHPEARWGLRENIVERTRTRYRVSLEGLWRFGPVLQEQERPERLGMGWLRVPDLWTDSEAIVYDPQGRILEGFWMGKPLSEYRLAWLERELYAPPAWIGKLVFLTTRRHYRDAVVHVNGEPVAATKKSDEAVTYEISSYLVYPGGNLIDLKKRVASDAAREDDDLPVPIPLEVPRRRGPTKTFTDAKPVIYIDVIPAGPHLSEVQVVRQGADRWVANCWLRLPPIFPFPVRADDPVPQFEVSVFWLDKRRELVRKRFPVLKRPSEPWKLSFRWNPGAEAKLQFRLYELVDGEPVLRDEYYPIEVR